MSSFLPLVASVAALGFATSALADQTLSTRTVNPNGRPVQEIRLGEEPGSSSLRAVVVTNGPVAGTTTLLTAVAAPNHWYDPAATAPVFTPVIAQGTVFSVGGGCTRGNRTDFPFINANRPQILRVENGVVTTFPVPIQPSAEQFDSAECAVSPDLLATWYIYSNRSTSRVWVMVDRGGPNDLNGPLVTFPAKTPFQGGLRPAIGNIFHQNAMALLFMEASGQTRWRQFNPNTINVDFNCLAGTQSPAPTTFTIPRGARVMGTSVTADFNGDGTFDAIDINTANCATAPTPTPAGLVAGAGFVWTEMASVVTPDGGRRYTIGGTMVTFEANGGISVSGGPHAGNGGPFDACGIKGPETGDGIVSLTVESTNLVRITRWIRLPLSLPPGSPDPLFRSSLEDPGTVDGWRCVEIELRR